MSASTGTSPGYLAKHGTPLSPDLMEGYEMIGLASSRTVQKRPVELTIDGKVVEVVLPVRVLVIGADTSAAAAKLGFGLVQAPRYRFADDVASGTLFETMSDHPPTATIISILYPDNRHLTPPGGADLGRPTHLTSVDDRWRRAGR